MAGGINTKELDKLRTDTDKKFEKVDTFMLTVVIILVVMVANILITLTMWLIDSKKDIKQELNTRTIVVPVLQSPTQR